MVRGCQKKIVYLKNTDSSVFDEAYFLLCDDVSADISECDMIKEANRILDECISFEEKRSKRQIVLDFVKEKIIPFTLGIVLGVIITIIIK